MGRKNRKAVVLLLSGLLLLASCVKDKPNPANPMPGVDSAAQNVYVICEGNFGNGNSSLGLYRPFTDERFDDVFLSVNQQSLGDVFQSMTRIDDRFFLCINNSDKILVINRSDWKLQGSIPVSKPRYIVKVSDTKAYVSALYTNKLTIINPQTLAITGTVTLPGNNPEGMLLLGDKLLIALWDTSVSKVYSVNTATDQVSVFSSQVGAAPKELLLDRDSSIWVLSGNIQKAKNAELRQVDWASGGTLRSLPFPAGADPMRLVQSRDGKYLYFIEVDYSGTHPDFNGVFRMGVSDGALPAVPLVAASSLQYFWALGIDPETGNLYIGDPKGFTQRGQVYIYNTSGEQLKTFSCGVGPGHFYFDK